MIFSVVEYRKGTGLFFTRDDITLNRIWRTILYIYVEEDKLKIKLFGFIEVK